MKKVAYLIILWWTAFLLVGGCSRDVKEYAEDEVLVNLNISVALSDVARPAVRSVAEYAEAVGNNEKMQTLRVIVVRPNGIVEYNEFIPLSNALYYGDKVLKVVGNEEKRIYFFVNERAELVILKGDDNTKLEKSLTDYFEGIKQGSVFPETEISELKIRLEQGKQLTGALPMNECHEIKVKDKDKTCQLFVTRAAIKFSFHIMNYSSDEITGFTISDMASEEYYLPRNTGYLDEEIDGDVYKVITEYEVPDCVDYDYNEVLSIKGDESVKLKPIYLLEGKARIGENDGYFVSIKIGDGEPRKRKLPNLPYGLPRNTNVVVNVKVYDGNIVVDVEPYRKVELYPDFGL